ncbi:MAG: UMP kinase [Hadesarchaea archaeon]|nr:UMP kinase [Hadesarchaea archaeon]
MRVTLCFGGSILAPEELDMDCIRAVAQMLRALKSQKHEVLVVTGGGRPSRKYIEAARKLKASNTYCDIMGIDVTRLNARLMIAALGDLAEREPLATFEAAIRVTLKGKVPVMGGVTPGQTTDAVAAMLASSSKSELLVFFTDVGGVYTADPKLNPRAKKLEVITVRELMRLVTVKKMKPGISMVIDPVGAKLIQRTGIRTLVLGRRDIKRLPEILRGAKHSGTTIVPG